MRTWKEPVSCRPTCSIYTCSSHPGTRHNSAMHCDPVVLPARGTLFSAKNSKLFRFPSSPQFPITESAATQAVKGQKPKANFETSEAPEFSSWVRVVHVLFSAVKITLHSPSDEKTESQPVRCDSLYLICRLSLLHIFQISLVLLHFIFLGLNTYS